MSLKVVELDMDDCPQYTAEEFAALPPEKQMEAVKRSIEVMKKKMFLYSFAILKFSQHDESCTDPNICSCTLSAIQDMAHETVMALEKDMNPRPTRMN